jgi:hypothetical protein
MQRVTETGEREPEEYPPVKFDDMTRDEYIAWRDQWRNAEAEYAPAMEDGFSAANLGLEHTTFQCACDDPNCRITLRFEIDGTRMTLRLDAATDHFVIGKELFETIAGLHADEVVHDEPPSDEDFS